MDKEAFPRSLLRKIVKPEEKELCQMLLTPTRIYWPIIKHFLDLPDLQIKGLAHITGGGWTNLLRVNKSFDYHITDMPSLSDIPPVFSVVDQRLKIPLADFLETFNRGIGMMMVVKPGHNLKKQYSSLGEKYWRLGHVEKSKTGKGKLIYH